MQIWKTQDGRYVCAKNKAMAALANGGALRWVSYTEAMELVATGQAIEVIRSAPVIEKARLVYDDAPCGPTAGQEWAQRQLMGERSAPPTGSD